MTVEAADILREEARYRFPTLQYHQDRIRRLTAFLGWGLRRTRSIYNGEEGVSLRGAETIKLQELKEVQERRRKHHEEAKNAEGYRILEARFLAVEAELAAIRSALSAGALEDASLADRRSHRNEGHSGAHPYGRRSTDRPRH